MHELEQEIPVKVFTLGNDVRNGDALIRIASRNPADIICTYIAPDVELKDARSIGSASVNCLDAALEYYPELNTKYSKVALCMWMPQISEIHVFFAVNLRFCMDGVSKDVVRMIEGGKFVSYLNQVAPNSLVHLCTPEYLTADNVKDWARCDLGFQPDNPTDFHEGW